jgi:hypothetical protein
VLNVNPEIYQDNKSLSKHREVGAGRVSQAVERLSSKHEAQVQTLILPKKLEK